MDENDYLDQIQQAEEAYQLAKSKIESLRKQLADQETELITASLQKERAQESLRRFRLATVCVELTEKEMEINGFRERNPELCAFAKERDRKKWKQQP